MRWWEKKERGRKVGGDEGEIGREEELMEVVENKRKGERGR